MPSTLPLNPINPDNAGILRITAAAGTELADPIHTVHTKSHTWEILFPYKRSLRSIEPSSFTLLGWFRLSPIDQYSSLLPPVGVWTVSQYQCGDLPLRTPIDRRFGGPLPRQQANGTHAYLLPINLYRYHAIPRFYQVLIFLSKGYPP